MQLNPHKNTTKDYDRAGKLRNEASPVEKRLWVVLREAAKVAGLKFRRQQAVHPYIADFACMEVRLLVELDGDSHATQQGYDLARGRKLNDMCFSIMRISNYDVMKNVEGVVLTIINKALFLRNAPLPNPPREGEGTSPFLLQQP